MECCPPKSTSARPPKPRLLNAVALDNLGDLLEATGQGRVASDQIASADVREHRPQGAREEVVPQANRRVEKRLASVASVARWGADRPQRWSDQRSDGLQQWGLYSQLCLLGARVLTRRRALRATLSPNKQNQGQKGGGKRTRRAQTRTRDVQEM